MKDSRLFDSVGTPIGSYGKEQFVGILEQAVAEVAAYLRSEGPLRELQEENSRKVKEAKTTKRAITRPGHEKKGLSFS